jgi:Methylamine utilisation protein MauE
MFVDITISYILRFLLVYVFLRAVLHKLGGYSHFKAQLGSYRLLPAPLIPAFSFFLIFVEGFLVFGLLAKEWLYPSFISAAVLAVYAVAMSINLIRGRDDLDCGCSGPSGSGQRLNWALVIRNGVLAFFALATALPITSRAQSMQDVYTVLLASIAVIFIYASIEQAIANQQRQTQYFALKRKDRWGTVE